MFVYVCMVFTMCACVLEAKIYSPGSAVSMEFVGRVLDELISVVEEENGLRVEKGFHKCKPGECGAHGKCQVADGICKCDKGWWGGYCDKVNACNEKPCASGTCFGDCPAGTAHCMATSNNAKGRFCYGPKFEFMEKYQAVTRAMVDLALRIADKIEY